jgi:hypothetical protein
MQMLLEPNAVEDSTKTPVANGFARGFFKPELLLKLSPRLQEAIATAILSSNLDNPERKG